MQKFRVNEAAGMTSIPLAFSHVGLFVYDLDRMVRFYQSGLGLVVTDQGSLPGYDFAFLSLDKREHHQLVLVSGRTGALDVKLVNQISFRVASLEDLQVLHAQVRDNPDATDFRGTNHGNAWSLYVHDPEGNRVELFTDTPWYVAQPRADLLDLSLPADEIRRLTETMCRADPSFLPAESWRIKIAEKIARGVVPMNPGR